MEVSYGGQAVIEGVMMRGPRHMVLSVRGPDGKVVSLTRPLDSLAHRSKACQVAHNQRSGIPVGVSFTGDTDAYEISRDRGA